MAKKKVTKTTAKKGSKLAVSIEEEVKSLRKDYYTDSYPMSLTEIESLYTNGKLILDPDFQRIFRWKDEQRSRFVESILLKLPIPSIFLYQNDQGKLEVVDGLQRISTWLQFLGVLEDRSKTTPEKKVYKEPLVLNNLKIIKSLNGYCVKPGSGDIKKIPEALIEISKLQKLQLQIITSDSDPQAKFEIFRRINTGGSFLSNQELRNALFVMLDKKFYDWVVRLSSIESFNNVLSLSDKQISEKYNMELVLKFLILMEYGWGKGNVSDYIDEKAMLILKDNEKKKLELEKKFTQAFEFLNETLKDKAFKKWSNGTASGMFLESGFEVVSLAVIRNFSNLKEKKFKKDFPARIAKIWSDDKFTKFVGSGTNAETRIPKIIEYSEKHFD